MESRLLGLEERITFVPELKLPSFNIDHKYIVSVDVLGLEAYHNMSAVLERVDILLHIKLVSILIIITYPLVGLHQAHVCIVDWQLVLPVDVIFDVMGLF